MVDSYQKINGPSRPPLKNGPAKSVIVLLHGYGADGNDLLSLADHWAGLLPESAFHAPHAPFPCEASSFGRQWFGFQGRSETDIFADAQKAALLLDGYLDGLLKDMNLEDGNLALVGFSQGTMMALQTGLRRSYPVAGILGFSGALLAPESLAKEIKSRPPVLLIHGTDDPVLPFEAMGRAQEALQQTNVSVVTQARPGVGHWIDASGLSRGGEFLVSCLSHPAS